MFGISVVHNTISVIARQTCEAILAEYGDEVLQCPHTSDTWKQVSATFSRWNFHHTLGAIDGKHVPIRCPKFLWVDVGTNGSSSDVQIFNECYLRLGIVDGTLDIPDAEPLPYMPYFLIGDDTFSLRTWLMKLFSARGLPDEERIFNYRLSHARRVVENSFASWPTDLVVFSPPGVRIQRLLPLLYCTLHIIMRLRYPGIHQGIADEEDDNHRVIPGQWKQGACLQDIEDVPGGNRDIQVAKRQRLYLKHYYNVPVGATAWQRDMI